MALHELGMKLASAFQKLGSSESADDEALKSTMTEISRALLEADVNIALVKQLRDNVTRRIAIEDGGAAAAGPNLARLVERAVFDELVRMLDPGKEPFKPKKGKANVIMFVGLQGAGKTTTVAKVAHYYQSRRWKVAMVCADTFRAGAFDQLKQNATRVRVPFYGSYTEPDPVKIAAEGVEQFKKDGYEIIIVDTSGRHKQETALFEEMEQVAAAVKPNDIVFVMDATIGSAAQGQAKAFKDSVPVGSVIISKLDGHAKGGGALSAVAATGSPIVFIGMGEKFDDLQPFDANGFVGKLLGRGDMKGLLNEMKDKGIMEDNEEMAKRLEKGRYTFRDLHDHFASIMKLGSVGKILDALPGGMGQMLGQAMQGEHASKQLRRMMDIMRSMTHKELDCEVPLEHSRILRIARGSGAHPREVHMLSQQRAQMEKMVGGMSKAGLLKGGDAALEAKLKRNPGAVMQQLQKSMDPRMLQSVGGAGGFMDILKGLTGGGGGAAGGAGGPGGNPMAALANMFGGGGGAGGNPMAAMMGAMGGGGPGGGRGGRGGGGGRGGRGGGGGGMPGMPPGGMPSMEQMASMMKKMGFG